MLVEEFKHELAEIEPRRYIHILCEGPDYIVVKWRSDLCPFCCEGHLLHKYIDSKPERKLILISDGGICHPTNKKERGYYYHALWTHEALILLCHMTRKNASFRTIRNLVERFEKKRKEFESKGSS
jgi:hypothetical protein